MLLLYTYTTDFVHRKLSAISRPQTCCKRHKKCTEQLYQIYFPSRSWVSVCILYRDVVHGHLPTDPAKGLDLPMMKTININCSHNKEDNIIQNIKSIEPWFNLFSKKKNNRKI